MIRGYRRADWLLLHLSGTSNYLLTSNVMPVLRILERIQSCFCWCNSRMIMHCLIHFCYWYYLIRGVWNNKQHKQRRRKIIKLGYNVIFEISMEYFKAQTWFGYGLILCGLCTCLTWSSSCWIIPIKQNFKHSLKNTVWQLKFCYFYFIVIIFAIIIFFKSKKDKTLFFAQLDRLIRLGLVEG